MEIIVKKFGGSSLANISKIKNIARKIKEEIKDNDKLYKFVIVVSAMGKTTNELISQTIKVSNLDSNDKNKEYDSIISVGEQISSGILALCLLEIGVKAKSLSGWKIPIYTDNNHKIARIKHIHSDCIINIINDGYLPIITGFQGINSYNNIATLGRSGSDISAVAVAAALKANKCQIYTDVSGLCTADPRMVVNSRKIPHIKYNIALEISINGAHVIHPRAIEIAQKYNLTLEIKSTFLYNKNGTIINNKTMEQQEIKSIASQSNDTLFEITEMEYLYLLLEEANNQNIPIDILHHDFKSKKILFKTPSQNKDIIINILNNLNYYHNTIVYDNISIISIIGTGMILYSSVTTQIIKYLADHDIELIYLHTSEIKIQLIIEKKYLKLSLNLIHDLCKL